MTPHQEALRAIRLDELLSDYSALTNADALSGKGLSEDTDRRANLHQEITALFSGAAEAAGALKGVDAMIDFVAAIHPEAFASLTRSGMLRELLGIERDRLAALPQGEKNG